MEDDFLPYIVYFNFEISVQSSSTYIFDGHMHFRAKKEVESTKK